MSATPEFSAAATPLGKLSGVVGATRFPNGTIVIATAVSRSLTRFDRNGEVVGILSRGVDSTPGLLRWFGRCPGTRITAAYDYGHQTVETWDDSGHKRFVIRVPRRVSSLQVLTCTADSTVVAMLRNPLGQQRATTGDTTSPAHVLVLRDGKNVAGDTIETFGRTDFFLSRALRGFAEIPLGHRALATAGREHLYLGESHSPTILIVDQSGTRIGQIDTGLATTPATVGDLLQWISRRLAEEPFDQARAKIRAVVGEARLRHDRPLYDWLLVDGADLLWLRTFERTGGNTARWRVFDDSGRTVSLADLPAALHVFEIGRDYVLGVERRRDSTDLVLSYRLTR